MTDRPSLLEVLPEPYFFRRCLICGEEIRTPWGPEVHGLSAHHLRQHVEQHSERELAQYARQEALRGI